MLDGFLRLGQIEIFQQRRLLALKSARKFLEYAQHLIFCTSTLTETSLVARKPSSGIRPGRRDGQK